MVTRLHYYDEEEFSLPTFDTEAVALSRLVAQSLDSKPGPERVKYSDIKALN